MRAHVLQHVPFEGLGSIAHWLADRKADVSVTRFFESPALPSLGEVDLLIALGGPMSVNDERELPWLADEKRLVAEAVRAGKPVLGICLGAQLLACSLGGRVYPGPAKEIGWLPVRGEPAQPGLFAFPSSVLAFHWHGETFDLPPGGALLASSAGCRHQAFQAGPRALGLQFHLETTPASAASLLSECAHELVPGPFIQTAEQIRAAPAGAYAAINALMVRVLDYLTRGAA